MEEDEGPDIEEQAFPKPPPTLYENFGIPHIEQGGRSYSYLGTMHPVKTSYEDEFELDFSELRKICEFFYEGYVISRGDFDTVDGFQEAISQLSPVPVRITAGRFGSQRRPGSDCKPDRDTRLYAQLFKYVDERTGKHLDINATYWAPNFPNNRCADKLRLTVAATRKGYVDVPNIARLPVVCGYGGRPKRQDFQYCVEGAHWNITLKRCECDNPKLDGKVVDPEKYKDYPWGFVCLHCEKTLGETKTVFFIIDSSGSVSHTGWEQVGGIRFSKKISVNYLAT